MEPLAWLLLKWLAYLMAFATYSMLIFFVTLYMANKALFYDFFKIPYQYVTDIASDKFAIDRVERIAKNNPAILGNNRRKVNLQIQDVTMIKRGKPWKMYPRLNSVPFETEIVSAKDPKAQKAIEAEVKALIKAENKRTVQRIRSLVLRMLGKKAWTIDKKTDEAIDTIIKKHTEQVKIELPEAGKFTMKLKHTNKETTEKFLDAIIEDDSASKVWPSPKGKVPIVAVIAVFNLVLTGFLLYLLLGQETALQSIYTRTDTLGQQVSAMLAKLGPMAQAQMPAPPVEPLTNQTAR